VKNATGVYEIRLHKDHRGVDLISDVLPFGRLWYEQSPDAVGYAKFFSRSHDAVIRVFDKAGNLSETQQLAGDFTHQAAFLASRPRIKRATFY